MRGWLLDVHLDEKENAMALWIKGKNGTKKFLDRDFHPAFYVQHKQPGKLKELAKELDGMRAIKNMEVQLQRIDLGSDKKCEVLAVTPEKLSRMRQIARLIDGKGDYYHYKLYNVDFRLAQRYMVERGLFPMCLLETDTWKCLEGDRLRLRYSIPELSSVHLDVRTSSKLPSMKDGITGISLREEDEREHMVLEGSETELLEGLANSIMELDPDIIYTNGGDRFVLPFLEHRAEKAGLEDYFLGRERMEPSKGRKGRSYFSYGRILYKPAAQLLRGRIHIDKDTFFYAESGLHGIMEMSRLSCIPLQAMSRLSPGTAISAMQVNQAMQDGCLVMWKKNLPETFKTVEELLVADRGGFIFDPVPGVYEGVVEVDFVSLYPNIMARFNISPETMLCSCCPGSRNVVPELMYNVCENRTGLIPRVVEPLVQRRIAYKRMAKEGKGRMAEMYKARSDALKWVLVTCFGYTGYKNSRFGRIECHESITAYGRDIILKTKALAEASGYRVLHGIVDSLWMEPSGTWIKEPEDFCKLVTDHTGIPLELEGVYKWLVFLPNKCTGAGALNKYYGAFQDGSMKVRGIELRKHDTPGIIKKAQEDIIALMAEADDRMQVLSTVPVSLAVMEAYRERLRKMDVDMEDLIIRKRVSRAPGRYRHVSDQAAAQLLLKAKGHIIRPGQMVRYIITDHRAKEPVRRVSIPEFTDRLEHYDWKRYDELLVRAVVGMLSPLMPRSGAKNRKLF